MKSKQNFSYTSTDGEYLIQLKRRNYWWLLLFLLLLLPLILLIEISKDVKLKTVDEISNNGLAKTHVQFSYTFHSMLAAAKPVSMKDSTNAEGIVIFKNVKYTLFQRLFFANEKAEIIAKSSCFMGDSITPPFFDLKHNEEYLLKLPVRAYDLNFQVIDEEDSQPIPNAKVEAVCNMNGSEIKWSETSDANGMVVLKKLPYCYEVKAVGSAYGYLNDTLANQVKFITGDIKARTLKLKPLKDMVKFSVKDLYSKQPLPDAMCLLLFEKDTIKVRTNTNGVGKGVFENVRIVKQMRIKASHVFYHDTITVSCKVEEFVKKSEDDRTVYLRPEMQNITFRDIDGANSTPLEGVTNQISINGSSVGSQMSNANGTFIVAGLKPTDRISIVASKSGFGSNNTTINNKLASELTSDASRDIPLSVTPPPPPPPPGPREGCRAYFAGTLVSDEYVEGHISEIYKVDKYSEYVGEGEYPDNVVAFPKAVATSFDGIAIDKGTRVIIYSGKNFSGNVVLDKTGPAIINNIKWVANAYIKDFQSKQYRGDLQSNFPPSCRIWSSENMNDWSNGSLKVICNQ